MTTFSEAILRNKFLKDYSSSVFIGLGLDAKVSIHIGFNPHGTSHGMQSFCLAYLYRAEEKKTIGWVYMKRSRECCLNNAMDRAIAEIQVAQQHVVSAGSQNARIPAWNPKAQIVVS